MSLVVLKAMDRVAKRAPSLALAPLLALLLTTSACQIRFTETPESQLHRYLSRVAKAVTITPVASFKARQCAELTVRLLTADGQPADPETVTEPVFVDLNAEHTASGTTSPFYRTLSGCNSGLASGQILTTTVPPGTNAVKVYFKNTKAGDWLFEPVADSMQTDSSVQTIVGAAPFSTSLPGEQYVSAGQCAELAIDLLDQDANLATNETSRSVGLSVISGIGTIYSNSICSLVSPATVTMGATASQMKLYFRSDLTNDVTVRVAVQGLSAVTRPYYVQSGQPTQLAILQGGTEITNVDYRAGDCTAWNVQARDSFGNPANVAPAAGMRVDLVLPNGSALEVYGSLASCPATSDNAGSTIAFFTIDQNTNAKTIYVRQRQIIQDHRVSVRAFNQSGQELTDAARVTIHAGKPKIFVVSGGQTQIAAGDCVSSAYTLSLKDQWQNVAKAVNDLEQNTNVTAALSTSRGETNDKFFSTSACSGGTVTSATILGGQQTTTFSFSATRASKDQPSGNGIFQLLATGTGMTNGTTSMDVAPKAATVLDVYSVDTMPLLAGQCGRLRAAAKDLHGNWSKVTAAAPLVFSGLAATHIFSNSSCTASASQEISSDTTEREFYYKRTDVPDAPNTSSFPLTVTASGGVADDDNDTVQVKPAAPSQMAFNPSTATTVTAGLCSSHTLVLRDQYNNFSGNHSGLSLTNTNGGGSNGSFSDTGSCTGTMGGFSAGQYTRNFGFIGRLAGGPYTISVTVTGGISASRQVSVNPGSPNSLELVPTVGPTQLTLNRDCSIFSLTVKDSEGNVTTFGAATNASFTTSSTANAVNVFDNASCSGGGGSSILFGASTSIKIFSFKGVKVADITLLVSAGGLNTSYSTIQIERLDLSYGAQGRVERDLVSSKPDTANAVVRLSNGKFAVAGYYEPAFSNRDFMGAIIDSDAAGTVLGTHTQGFGSTVEEAYAVVQVNGGSNNGMVLSVGCTQQSSTGVDIAVVLFNPNNGALSDFERYDLDDDPGDPFDQNDCAYAAVAASGGIVYLAGYVELSGNRDAAVIRLDTNEMSSGTAIPTYERLNLGGSEEARAIIMKDSNSVYVAGNSGSDFLLFQVDIDGGGGMDVNSSFNSSTGYAIANFGGTDVANALVQTTSNQLVIVGYTSSNFAFAQFTPGGGLVDTHTLDLGAVDLAYSAVALSGDRVVAVGKRGNDFAIARVTSDLSGLTNDSTFGKGSLPYVTTDFGSTTEEALATTLTAAGEILAVGYTNNATRDTALSRYMAD